MRHLVVIYLARFLIVQGVEVDTLQYVTQSRPSHLLISHRTMETSLQTISAMLIVLSYMMQLIISEESTELEDSRNALGLSPEWLNDSIPMQAPQDPDDYVVLHPEVEDEDEAAVDKSNAEIPAVKKQSTSLSQP